MKSDSSSAINPFDNTIESVAGLLSLVQLLLLFYFDNFGLNIIIFGLGWLMLIPSFLLLTLSLKTLKTYGDVLEGRSLVDTTVIVKKGVYGIIRHPLYVGWMLLSISLVLISQSWLSTLCALIIAPLVMIIISREDRANSIKFNEDYEQYQQEVPLANVFKGFWRYHRREQTS